MGFRLALGLDAASLRIEACVVGSPSLGLGLQRLVIVTVVHGTSVGVSVTVTVTVHHGYSYGYAHRYAYATLQYVTHPASRDQPDYTRMDTFRVIVCLGSPVRVRVSLGLMLLTAKMRMRWRKTGKYKGYPA